MNHFNRDLIEATFNQLTNSQHDVLGSAPLTKTLRSAVPDRSLKVKPFNST